jgi:hypothetical protein
MQECKNENENENENEECRSASRSPAFLTFLHLHSCISAFLHSCIRAFEMPSSSQRLGLVVAVVAFAMYVLIRVR